jgi:hypothetical protein
MAHLGAIAFLAFYYGVEAVSADALSPTAGAPVSDTSSPLDLNADIFIRCIVVAVVTGATTAAVMFELLRRLGGGLIRASIIVSGGLQIAAGVGLAIAGVYVGAVLVLTGAATLLYLWCVRARVAFAAAHVSIASAAVSRAPGLALVAVGCLVAQAAWSILWGLAALGLEFLINNKGEKTGGNDAGGLTGTIAAFAMLTSYFWVSVFIRNVAAFCAASVTGDYWWKGASERAPTFGAIRRALTTSFGTLSLSALLVSIVRTAKALARMQLRKAEGRANNAAGIVLLVLAIAVSCIVSLFAAVLEWANVRRAAHRCARVLFCGPSRGR